MRVLIACEESGVVREEFQKLGHDAWSCDILPTSQPGNHIQDDVLNHLDDGWDLMVAHPPCTFLTVSGARWFYHPDDRHLPVGDRRPHPLYPNRAADREEAAEFFMCLYNSPIPKVALENPVGAMSTIFRKPDQIIKPHWFGDPSTKKTCFWLRGLPHLKPTNVVEPEVHVSSSGRKWDKWWFETSRICDLKERSKIRSRTFLGIARAIAEQWGGQP